MPQYFASAVRTILLLGAVLCSAPAARAQSTLTNITLAQLGPEQGLFGGHVRYVVRLTNVGPEAALDVVLKNNPPVERAVLVTNESDASCSAEYDGSPVTCAVGVVGLGSRDVAITFAIPTCTPGAADRKIENTVSLTAANDATVNNNVTTHGVWLTCPPPGTGTGASSPAPGPVPSSESGTPIPALPEPKAQVEVSLTPDGREARAGGDVTYSVELKNEGNAPAEGVTVEAAFNPQDATVADSGGGLAGEGVIRWDASAIEPGGSRLLSYRLTLGRGLPGGRIVRTSVVVRGAFGSRTREEDVTVTAAAAGTGRGTPMGVWYLAGFAVLAIVAGLVARARNG